MTAPGHEDNRNQVMAEPQTPYLRPAHLVPYPYLSLEERDRRWGAIWRALEDRGLDGLLIPPAIGAPSRLAAAARYVTHIGGWNETPVAVIMPVGAEPIVVVPRAEDWRQLQPWCGDLHDSEDDLTATFLSMLRDMPMRRVGILGWGHGSRESDVLSDNLVQALMNDFGLACDDFTPHLDSLRMVKSAEEIAFVERSAPIVTESVRRSVATIRPEMPERELWATLLESTLVLGSDAPVRIRQASRTPGEKPAGAPSTGTIGPDWASSISLESAWGGYRARCTQPVSLRPPSLIEGDLMRWTAAVWNSLTETIKPGMTTHALRKHVSEIIDRGKPRGGPLESVSAVVSIRGAGPGFDEPILALGSTAQEPADSSSEIRENWCFFLGIRTHTASVRLLWGDTVVVTAKGARRVGNNAQSILTP